MAFRSASSLVAASAANAVIAVPSGAANLDIAVIGLYLESTAAITGISAGFTNKVSLQTSAVARGRLDVFWKRLSAADTGTYTFSWTGSAFRAAACGLWSGRSTSGDPFDGTVGTAENTVIGTTLNVSTSPAAALGDAAGFWTDFSGGNAWTPPASYTERQDLDVITFDSRDSVAAGTTGNVSATASISGFMKAFLGVLAPAGAVVKAPATVSQYTGFY